MQCTIQALEREQEESIYVSRMKTKIENESLSLPLSFDLNDIHGMQLFQDVTSNSPTALAEMWWAAPIPFAPSIYLLKTTYSDPLPQIDLSCHWSCMKKLMMSTTGRWLNYGWEMQELNGCSGKMARLWLANARIKWVKQRRMIDGKHTCSDVVPVWIIWSELLEPASLHYIYPVWQFHLFIKQKRRSRQTKWRTVNNCKTSRLKKC